MLRLALLAAVLAALFPATATAADGPIAFVVAEAGLDVVGADGGGRRPLLREAGAYSPDWSPDGRRVVYSAGELRVASADGTRVVGLGVSGGAPAWSPDGSRIAFHAGGDIQVARVTADLQVLGVARVTAGRSPTWSPDGARLAYVTAPYDELHVIEAGGGVPERLAPGLAAADPDWSPDGRRIAFASGSDVWALDLATGTPERLVTGGSQPAWAPSGGRLAYASGGDVRALDLASRQSVTLAGGPGSESAPAWAGSAPPAVAPYGPGIEARHVGRIAFTRRGEIYAMNPGGGDVRRLTRNAVVDGEPAWAPPVPGRPARLAFTRSGQIQIMRADGRGTRPLTRSPGLDRAPAWSPDGRAIAFTRIPPGEPAEVWIAETDGGGERRVSPAGAGAYGNPSWSPDGEALAFERFDPGVRIPPDKFPVHRPSKDAEGKDTMQETRVIGFGFCTQSIVTGELACRDSADREFGPAWGGAHERVQGRLVYVAVGVGAPDFDLFERGLWSTELVTGTPYAHHRWAYDTRILADLQDPADPAIAPDGSGLVVAARQEAGDDEYDIAIVRMHRRGLGSPEFPDWYVIESDTFWLARGTQPAWEARRAPLPRLADGAFERRARVRARMRRGRLTLVNRNRFWVTARVGRRSVRVRPVGRRSVRVDRRVRRLRVLDTAGHRRVIRVT